MRATMALVLPPLAGAEVAARACGFKSAGERRHKAAAIPGSAHLRDLGSLGPVRCRECAAPDWLVRASVHYISRRI
jgi:hypothetical protein